MVTPVQADGNRSAEQARPGLRYSDAAFLDDPYPSYKALRDLDPVHHHVGSGTDADPDFWALTRFAHVDAAVRDTGTFSSAHGLTYVADEIGKLGLAPTIVMMDPPEHSAKRRLIARAFTPRRVAETEPAIRAHVRSSLEQMSAKAADGEAVDLHVEFSSTVPTFVLSRLLGVPEADRGRFYPWVHALTTLQDSGLAFSRLEGGAVQAVAEMFEYFGALIAERRSEIESGREVPDDLVTGLLHAEIDGEKLTDWDVLGFCFVLVAGGNDTTGNLISHTVMLLDGDHAQRELLLSDMSMLPEALEDCLRLESSVQGLARATTREVEVDGTTIPEGVKVMMLYGSANRDEREFGPTADRVDLRREHRRHLAFAQGPHFCIGSHFAKLQARIAVGELYTRHPHVGVDLAGARRGLSPFTRGFVTLPATGLA